MNDLRLELRTRNNVLWHAIFDIAPSVAEFCRQFKISTFADVGALLNLRYSPYGKRGPIALARRLCDVTGLDMDTLFPPALYTGRFVRRLAAEVESVRWVGLEAASHLALPAAQETAVQQDEVRDLLLQTLHTLTPREERVIRARFGLDDGEEQTLKAIADTWGVSQERMRQIQAKALRKLQHPSRSRVLRAVCEPIGVD